MGALGPFSEAMSEEAIPWTAILDCWRRRKACGGGKKFHSLCQAMNALFRIGISENGVLDSPLSFFFPPLKSV